MQSEQPVKNIQRIQRILLPLDGSTFAEIATPVALRLATALHAELVVARIIPTMVWTYAAAGGPVSADAYDRILKDEEREAGRYVTDTVVSARGAGVSARAVAARGDIASALLDIITQEAIDLVVMSSHGRTGAARFALGSIADRLLRASAAPVWVVRPIRNGKTEVEQPFAHALVALDGSERAETAFGFVTALAGSVFTSVTLARVTSGADDEVRIRDGEAYLSQAASRLRGLLSPASVEITTELLHGGVTEELLASAEELDAVIVMATHGETGARRWAFGSVTDRVLHAAQTPVAVTRLSHT